MHKIVLAKYNTSIIAEMARLELLKEQERGDLKFEGAVVITKTSKGGKKISYAYEFEPDNTIIGSWFGMLVGAIWGIPFGPVGPVIGTLTGTALGGSLGALADIAELQGLQEEFHEALSPGISILIVDTDETNAPKIVNNLEQSEGIQGKVRQKSIPDAAEDVLKKTMQKLFKEG